MRFVDQAAGKVAQGIYAAVDLFTHGFYGIYDRIAEQRRSSFDKDVYTPPEGQVLKNAVLIPGTGLFDFSERFKETLLKGGIRARTCEFPGKARTKYFAGYPEVLGNTLRYFVGYDPQSPIHRVYGHSAGGLSAAICAGLAKASPEAREGIAQGIHAFIGSPTDLSVADLVGLGERFKRDQTRFVSLASPFFALNFRANLRWLVHVVTDICRGGLYSIFDRESHPRGTYSIDHFNKLVGKSIKEVIDANVVAIRTGIRQARGSWASKAINVVFGESLRFFGWVGTSRAPGERTDGLVTETSARLELPEARQIILEGHDHAFVIETIDAAKAVLGFEIVFDGDV